MAYQSVYSNSTKIRKQINQLRAHGFTNTEIYNTISENYNDKKTIAVMILSTPEKKYLEKYIWIRYVLMAILLCLIAIVTWLLIQHYSLGNFSNNKILFAAIFYYVILITTFFILIFSKSEYYNPLFFLIIMPSSNKLFLNYDYLYFTILGLIIVYGLLILYYRNKISPNLAYGQPKKNKEGKYILD